ncbi:MAG TPA: HDOD domain-containing protein [Tepidisphaeraceae bacterium]|nr:HDOD domain-containing protein [Tepidisphaeraceae bacterium]
MAAATAVAVDPKQYVDEAVKKITGIATLPEVTNKIIATVEDPKASASTLHKIVSHDPALVSRILKVVNSSFYGLPGQIGSVERAIVLLGLNAVKNIAVAASLGQMFRGVKLCEEFTAKDLWTHCMAVAVTSRELAKQMKLPIADEAFLAGMIHDLGLLVSLQVSPELLRAACERARTSEATFCEIEREVVGVDHQQLGAALAEHWKFPRSCQLVAGHHHHPAALSDGHRMLVTLVYVADTICCQANQGFNLTALRQKLDDAELGGVKLDLVLIEHTRANLPALLDTAGAMMG